MLQTRTQIEPAIAPSRLRLYAGTSGWVHDSWRGPFYPASMPPAAYLQHYAQHFSAVELDSTFHVIPSPATVATWNEYTPGHFTFTAKFPRIITYDKRLHDCETEVEHFLEVMSHLGPKLGPLVLQFDYSFQAEQQPILEAFLDRLPDDKCYAVEIRHRSWLNRSFFSMLQERSVALVLSDLHYMPRQDVATTDWVYIRWLGTRDQVNGDYSKTVVDRQADLSWWAQRVFWRLAEGREVFAFCNNHYAGHAPGTVRQFLEKLDKLYLPNK